MKQVFRVGSLCLAVLWAASFSADADSAPAIEFEQTRFDFGEVEAGKLVHEFTFKNTGDAVLEITKVQASCGCTAAAAGQSKIEPGQTGSIRAELDASKFKGRIEKGITISSNDPKKPAVSLQLVATIRQDLMVLPSQSVSFQKLKTDTATNTIVEIKSNLAEPLAISKVEANVPWLTVTLVETNEKNARIEVATKPPLLNGNNYGVVTVHTGYEKYKTLTINTSVSVPQVITAVPSRLFFLSSKQKSPSDISMLVMRNDGKEFHITGVETNSPFLSIDVVPNQPGRSYRLTVKYTPKDGQKPANDNIVIKTDEPTLPKLEVPVFFR